MEAQPSFEALHSLLRAELSALETYRHVLAKADNPALAVPVKKILEDHRESATMLGAQIEESGGDPHQPASTWKNIDLLAAELSRNPLRDPVALKALLEGEEQDELTYEGVLHREELDRDSREMVERMLLPRTRAHISALERLLCAM